MNRRRRGSAMLEYVLVGIPSLLLSLSVFEVSMAMWQYHTMAEASQIAARYIVTHGSTCNCAVNVGNIATVVQNSAVGLTPANINLTLTSSHLTVTCAVSSCITGSNASTAFPPIQDSTAGNAITVAMTYKVVNPLVMYWPGGVQMQDHSYTLGAQSLQEILY